MNAELSPDGQRAAVHRSVQNSNDRWLMDLVRRGFTRFTFDGAAIAPLWSPDAAQIAFASNRKGVLYVKPASGAGAEDLLLESPNSIGPQDWSQDGRSLLYLEYDPKTRADLWALEVNRKERKPRVVVKTPFDEYSGQFSPDGLWVAYL